MHAAVPLGKGDKFFSPSQGSAGNGDQGFSLSPDRRGIAFQMGKTVSEIRALENFLPKATAKR